MRAKYTYDKAANRIEVTQIPYTTTLEKIKSVIVSLVKNGRIKEIADVRGTETDLNGLKLTIDLERGSDSEKLMARLFKLTPLEDEFRLQFQHPRRRHADRRSASAKFWTSGRRSGWNACAARLSTIWRKRAISSTCCTASRRFCSTSISPSPSSATRRRRKRVDPNLMAGFGIDEKQAEYVADIKLRNINREYIVNRISEIDELEKETAELRELIADDRKIKKG